MKIGPFLRDPFPSNWLFFAEIEIAFSMTGSGNEELNDAALYRGRLSTVNVNGNYLFTVGRRVVLFAARRYLSKLNVIHLKTSYRECFRWEFYENVKWKIRQSRLSINRVYRVKEKKFKRIYCLSSLKSISFQRTSASGRQQISIFENYEWVFAN